MSNSKNSWLEDDEPISREEYINLIGFDPEDPGIRGGEVVLLKRMHPRAQQPKFATQGAACADFLPVLADVDCPLGRVHSIWLQPGELRAVRLGWGIGIPAGWSLDLHSRSGQGKARVSLANRTGIVDSDYTGEVLALVVNEGDQAFEIREDKAVCQAKLVPAPRMFFVEVDELRSTARADGGFGSTDPVAGQNSEE